MIAGKAMPQKKGIFFENLDLPSLLLAGFLGVVAAFITVSSPALAPVAVGGLLVLILSSRRAEIPFSLFVFSFAIPVQKTVAGLPLNMADGIIVLWGAAWPFLMARRRGTVKIPFIVWAALPLIAAACLSLLVAVNPGGSMKQVIRLIEWFVILPVLTMSLHPDKRFWDWTTILFLCVPSFFALDGIVEYLNHGNSLTKMMGIPVPIPDEHSSRIRHTFDVSGRAGSAFGGAQGLAMYLAMMMSIVIGVALMPARPVFRRLSLAALIVCLGGMFFTKSRGGFLGTLAMMVVILLIKAPRWGIAVIVAGGLAVGAGFLWLLIFYGWDGTITELIPGRPEAVLDRLIIWARALSIFSEHPVLGVGFGGFHDMVYMQGGIALNVPLGYGSLHSHNTYLEILTGTGLVGFVAFIGFLIACMSKLISLWINRKGLPSDGFIMAAIAALAAYMMFCMVDLLFLQNMNFMLISILMLGLMAGERQSEGENL